MASPLVVAGPAAAQYGPPDDAPNDDILDAFYAEREGPREFTFRWTIDAGIGDDVLVCTLDVDSDAVVEHSLENRNDDRSIRHLYEEPGTYHATLVIRSRDGGSDSKAVCVEAH